MPVTTRAQAAAAGGELGLKPGKAIQKPKHPRSGARADAPTRATSSSGGEPRSQDVLIGWRQLRGTKLLEESVIVNPANKDEKVVSAHDELLVIGKRGAMQRARRVAERHQAAAVSESKV